ncbi:MAG: KamA family radical SAM protein [Planctomycetaceae bacterium]|jgi:EF-P beta-lysylation protein EpmB|nr:KamA family radical SAM protein [Planctomycetaceae bacterium]
MSDEFICDIDELIEVLCLPRSIRANVIIDSSYPLLVPREFVGLMESGNPADPLLLQVLPSCLELGAAAGFSCNPLDERIDESNLVLKKYHARSLIFLTGNCGIHCRFCFRRHFVHKSLLQKDAALSKNYIEKILQPIQHDTTLREVILSGGDPLTIRDSELAAILDCIEKIDHVKRIRIHSRLPVVQPSRITEQLNTILQRTKPVYLVLHVNHPNELSGTLAQRLKILTAPILLSQTVLLRGINDDVDVLDKLFERLIDNRIVPYYLHQLDRVAGAAHFEVAVEVGCKLIAKLRSRLPGYAVPKYVQEIVNASSKKVLTE